jgi:hypothetical protein
VKNLKAQADTLQLEVNILKRVSYRMPPVPPPRCNIPKVQPEGPARIPSQQSPSKANVLCKKPATLDFATKRNGVVLKPLSPSWTNDSVTSAQDRLRAYSDRAKANSRTL